MFDHPSQVPERADFVPLIRGKTPFDRIVSISMCVTKIDFLNVDGHAQYHRNRSVVCAT